MEKDHVLFGFKKKQALNKPDGERKIKPRVISKTDNFGWSWETVRSLAEGRKEKYTGSL